MPVETRTTSTSHSGDAGDAGGAGEAVDKAESSRRDSRPLRVSDIDPEGDLFLDVAPDHVASWRFRVCSGTLRRQSPVWKTMLFGAWSESKPANGEEWVIQLPEDSAYAMHIVLCILHGRFDQVKQLQPGKLYQILILTNKYDMTSIVRPWSAQWIAIARDLKNSPENYSRGNMVKSLFVAWELGDEELFALRLEDLSMRTRMDTEGLLTYNKKVILNDSDHLGPQDALETICAIREALLERLITPIHEDLDARMKAEPYCKVGCSGYPKMLCDAATIGSIHRHMLQTRGSILPKSASEIEDSVLELGRWLFPMMSRVPTMHGSNPSDLHDLDTPEYKCFPVPKYRKLWRSIHEDIPAVVASFITPSHKEYMAAQRAKTGLVMQDGISTSIPWYFHPI